MAIRAGCNVGELSFLRALGLAASCFGRLFFYCNGALN